MFHSEKLRKAGLGPGQINAAASVARDEAGKLWLRLRGSTDKLAVSRLYPHLFKAM
jgi:DNA-binding LytR/AlgR family response regulator